MAITIGDIRFAITAINEALIIDGPRLTELDGKLGDGDLGITLTNAFKALSAKADALPEQLDRAFMTCAAAVAEVSSSSFGTLLATALIASGKHLGARESFETAEIADLLDVAAERMMARGKAALGDKTVLDAMHAVSVALRDGRDLDGVSASLSDTLDAFRDQPNKIGRARIFADRSVGLDDPGMVAFQVMTSAILGISDESSAQQA